MRGEWRQMWLMLALVVSLLLLRHTELQELEDQLAASQDELTELQLTAAMQTFPPLVFMLEARTPEELHNKLSSIAGEVDAERYKLWEATLRKKSPSKKP